ncbi:MAG: carboxyltransferase domain-containing protein, partial [Paracoccus sp. (in: a-proteobacteria)]
LSPNPAAMAAAQAMAAALTRDPPHGAIEVAPALVSVLLRLDPARCDPAALAAQLLAQAQAVAQAVAAGDPSPPAARRRWTIPAVFGDADGPHLEAIAARMGLTPQAAIRQLCDSDLRVLAIGFAPGQPYLGLLPEGWNLPRLPDLTPQVPAGALVVALRQVVMFGNASAT